jgi:hypothetical protein
MRLPLTSPGISNTSIRDALVDLLGKPISESSAVCIPTAAYAMPGGAGPLCESGWRSLGVPELTALSSIKEEDGSPWSRRLTRCWLDAVVQAFNFSHKKERPTTFCGINLFSLGQSSCVSATPEVQWAIGRDRRRLEDNQAEGQGSLPQTSLRPHV